MNALSSFLWIGLQLMRVALALMIAGWAINESTQGLSSDKWPTTNGKVTTSVVKKVSTKHGERDEAEIRYQYKVNGKEYTSNRVQFGGETFRNPAELVGLYRPQKQISIHYNPGNPSVSCLEGGVNSLVIIPSFLVALFFAFLALREEGKGKEKRRSYGISTAGGSAAIGAAGGNKDKARAVVIVPLIIMTFLGLGLKYCLEKGSLNGVHLGGLNLGAIPPSIIAIIVLFGGGLAFVFFLLHCHQL